MLNNLYIDHLESRYHDWMEQPNVREDEASNDQLSCFPPGLLVEMSLDQFQIFN